MKKLISILAVIAMLFTFTAIPSFAEGETVTVDFAAAANIAYQKVATTIVAEGEEAATLANVTDGNLETSDEVTGAFTLDLGANYQVNDIALYFGSEGASVNVYAGNAVDAANLIGSVTNETATVNANGKVARYITFETATTVTINEIYVSVQYLDGEWNLAKFGVAQHTFTAPKYGNIYTGGHSNSYGNVNLAYYNDCNPSTLNTGYNGTLNDKSGYTTIWTLDLGAYYYIDEVSMYFPGTKGAQATGIYLGMSEPGTVSPTNAKENTNQLTTDSSQIYYTIALNTERALVKTSNNQNGVDVAVNTLSIGADKQIARYISFVYSNRYSGWGCGEVSVKGSPVTGDVVDFRSHDNLAFGKKETAPNLPGGKWSHWGGNAPQGGNKSTNGDLKDYYSGHSEFTYRIDLGDIYDITKVDLYCASANSTDYNIYLDTTSSYDFGSKSSDRRKTDSGINKDMVTVNGIEIHKGSMEFDSVPARYVYINYFGTHDFQVSEIVVNGTKTVKFGEAGNYYEYKDGMVTAKLRLYNGTEAASTAGKVYFAAYNSNDALVGFTVADAAALEAGASTEIAPAAFEVTEEPSYVKAFYWVDGTFVPVLLPTNVK